MAEDWADWQLEILDNYILEYEFFETQEELASAIGKSVNAVKIKLSRRRKLLKEEYKNHLDINQYKIFLSNRFNKETAKVADLINVSELFLLNELDELDCLECKEYLAEGFDNRLISVDELNVFIRLIKKGRNEFQIAHILNRPLEKVQEMMKTYEEINI